MITSETSGVWELDDVYNKINAGYLSYSQVNVPNLYQAGNNANGLLGQNNTINYSSPIQVPGTQWDYTKTQSVSTHIALIKTDGSLWTWGYNNNGQLGLDDVAISRSSPTQIPGTQWSKVNTFRSISVSLKSDGTLWTWGLQAAGELGINSGSGDRRSSPVQVPGTQWSSISSGGGNCRILMVTKTDGTLWSWGYNSLGNLGINDSTTIGRSSPTQIPGTDWGNSKIACSTYHSLIAKSDGTLWVNGYNNPAYGCALGLNDAVSRSSPTQVPGTQWIAVSANQQGQSYGLKSDGTLWAWGQYQAGGLGLNDAVSRSSPTQLPGTDWSDIGSGYRSAHALKSDGTLWVWGDNPYGSTGSNDTVQRSSPTQIPGTQWIDIYTIGVAIKSQ